ncbi:unnamed protein product [Cyprideis torosa]|uniref:alpha-amylase n=1 Tax=Cyprideis torosa TaxID=163714 RepID=A0A7R8ZIG4_9CRUS|nr:unnamed protein product [Cyprideis torosa]CAG0886066.1 unnamed protein product [Cyprideis torosa]
MLSTTEATKHQSDFIILTEWDRLYCLLCSLHPLGVSGTPMWFLRGHQSSISSNGSGQTSPESVKNFSGLKDLPEFRSDCRFVAATGATPLAAHVQPPAHTPGATPGYGTISFRVMAATGVHPQGKPQRQPAHAHGTTHGYGTTSPPNENVVIVTETQNRPWFERWQPVSYKLETRSGTEEEFADMVRRCNAVNVRVYPDLVINHMTATYPVGTPGTGGSSFDSEALEYPGVPFTAEDFHGSNDCPTDSGNVESHDDPVEVRNCRLFGLLDLNQGKSHVRERILEYINRLIGYGIAGFLAGPAKYIWPEDLEAIFSGMDSLNPEFFPAGSRPFVFLEVVDLDGSEPITASDYTHIGRVTEFKYGQFLTQAWRKGLVLQDLENFGEEWGMQPGGDVVVFVDNHDNQRGYFTPTPLTFRDARMYKMANAFMLAWPYGFPRIMSSFYWEQDIQDGQDLNYWVGPPMDADGNILDVSCGNGWICEHRWREIANMVIFRNVVRDSPLENFVAGTAHQIAFARAGRGFVAINNDDFQDWTGSFETTLPQGVYCDVISGVKEDGGCTGKTVTVDAGGVASIDIPADEPVPMIAIHIGSEL